jgi:hypothetical protein
MKKSFLENTAKVRLLIILIILKLIGSINWSWSLVLTPLWVAIIVVIVGNFLNKRNPK